MNNKIKLYQLENIKNCKFKAYMSQFNEFKIANNKALMINQVYTTIIKDYDFVKLSNSELKDIINNFVEDKYFLTQQEKEVEINIIYQNLLRYITYESSLHRKILKKNVYGTVLCGNQEIDVHADMIVENNDNIEIIKFKTSATELSYKARTPKNLPENNMELYLMKKLGNEIYVESHSAFNKPTIASFYHFKGKKDKDNVYNEFLTNKEKLNDTLKYLHGLTFTDKKEQKANDKQIKEIEDILYFNNSVGNNIITFDYNKSLDEEILELTNTELSFNSERCKTSDCDFCSYFTLCNTNFDNDIKDNFDIVEAPVKQNEKVNYTEAQNQIINAEFGNHRANCVAGSGKSSSIVARTVNLLNKGYLTKDILLITFTNKGASELRDKIKKLTNVNTDKLHIFTFNSFGDSIVSKEWESLGFTEKPKLCTTVDVNDTIKEILGMEKYNNIEWLNYKNPLLNYPNAKGAFKQLTIYFNIIKSYSYDINKFKTKILFNEKTQYEGKAELIYEMYNQFNSMLKAKNLLQYQDQILYLIELFEKYTILIEEYGYKHIMVDEYQDTDFTQVKLLHLLKKYTDNKSLMVVGDSSQSIYGFRLTTPENIINFDKEFEKVNDIFLLDNFRSTPEICNLANKLDAKNTLRIAKDIISRKEHGKDPELICYDTINNEYLGIVEIIKKKLSNGIPKHNICVIARTKKELLEIQSKLEIENIPNIIESSELFIDNTYVQSVINLSNFFKNSEHDYYLLEYLYLTNSTLLNKTEDEIKDIVTNFKLQIITDFETLESEDDKIEYFYKLLAPIVEKDAIARTFVDNLKENKYYTFNQLLEYLYKVILYHDDTSIEKNDTKYDVITLTTAHSSKGKEWSILITTINSFKYETIIDNLSDLEEERRLLFVDITRAKDELYITYNTSQDKVRNKGKYCLFADELNEILSNTNKNNNK